MKNYEELPRYEDYEELREDYAKTTKDYEEYPVKVRKWIGSFVYSRRNTG